MRISGRGPGQVIVSTGEAMSAADLLFERRRMKELNRAQWMEAFEGGRELERETALAAKEGDAGGVCRIDPQARQRFIDEAAGCKNGLLLLTFHGGFKTIKRHFLMECETEINAVILRRGDIVSDRRTALFTSLRSLQQGRTVVMAPDGPHGRSSQTIDVLGHSLSIGDGAAFLAGTARCDTGCDNGFVPVLTKGPVIDKGEKLESYQQRLNDFYAAQLEDYLTGPPGDILPNKRLQKALGGR